MQYIGTDRTADWVEFYSRLFGFERLSATTRFGILHRGTVMQSPGSAHSRFFLQLIEPDAAETASGETEQFHRIGLGTPDVAAAVAIGALAASSSSTAATRRDDRARSRAPCCRR